MSNMGPEAEEDWVLERPEDPEYDYDPVRDA